MNVLRKLLPVSDSKSQFADAPGGELWEQAMQQLEEELGTHARPNLTYREIYGNTPAGGVRRRDPVRPAAPKPEGDELKRARRIAHTKMILARHAYEGTVAEYESLGGNRDDAEA